MKTLTGLGLFLFISLLNGVPAHSEDTSPAQKMSGVVTVSPHLQSKVESSDVLYVYIRQVGVDTGAPLAVRKIQHPVFPQSFELGPDSAMMTGTTLQGRFQVQAKLSKSGSVTTTKGDLMGKFDAKKKGVAVGTSGLKVELSSVAD